MLAGLTEMQRKIGSNRTFMELKCYHLAQAYGRSPCSNRTFMELKYVFTNLERLTKCSSNRTFMELKLIN